MIQEEENSRNVTIRMTDAEIAAVRDITKVDAIAPAVMSIIRKTIEKESK